MAKNREPSFSLNEFKKWMESQREHEVRRNHQIGTKVESKVSLKKLLEKIEPEEGELYQLAKDFKREGGTLLQMDGQALLVEVNSGTFIISRLFVRKSDL